MHNYCINPCQSLGYTRPSSHCSSSFTNYHPSCFLDHRFHTTTPVSISPSSCCCCACCSNSCSSSIYRLPINPSLLYGLRQSTLIQYSPSRKLILNGRNQCFSRFSVSDFDRGCSYEKYGSFKERGGGRKGGRWGKGRYGRMVYEESGNVADEVEMMLSLLTEEVVEESFGVRERSGRSSWRVKVEDEDEKSEDSDGISFRGGKKNVGSIGFRSSSKRDSDYDGARYREEIKRQKEERKEEEREKISRCEDCRSKIEGSTSKSNQGYDIARSREETKRQKEDRRDEGRANLSRIENHRARKEGSTLKIDQEYDTTQYKEEIKRHEEDRRQEGTENLSRVENRRARKEESAWKSDQVYDITRYRAEIKRHKEDRRQEGIENISRIENRRVRKEGSTLKSDQEYDTTRYREEIKRQKEDRREEGIESLSTIENHRARNEGSTLKIDQEYDTTRYREEIKRQQEDRREEGIESLSRIENRRVRNEGSTLKIDQEYDTTRYREEIKRQKEDGKYEEKENILRRENRKVRKEGSTFRIYREYDTAGYGEEIKRQKDDRREEERDNLSRSENRRLRKEGSSCSSYYSVSSAGEFESDSELQVKDDTFVGQSSIEYNRDQKRKEDIRYDGEVKAKVERLGDYVNEHESLLEKKKNAEKSYGESAVVEHDWRKKSENKVSEVMIEQAKSRKKQAEEHMRLSKIEQTGYVQRSDIQQQYIDKQEKSALAVNINVGMTVHHTLSDDRVSEQSESQIKHKKFQEMSELHSSVVETASSSQKRYRGVEKNESTSVSLVEETKGAFSETAGHFARQDAHRWDSEQDAEVSKIEEIDNKGEYSSLSETRMHEDSTSIVLGLDDDREEKYERAGQLVARQTRSQVKSQQMMGISELKETGTGSTSLSQMKADIRMKKQEEKSESAYLEAKVTDAQGVSHKSTNRQEMYSTSVVEANITDTQGVSKTSTDRQEMSSTSVVEFVDDTRQRHSLTGKGELQIEPLKATRRPVKATSFNEGMPKEVSSSYKSLKLIPESSVQQIGVGDDDKRSSRPPSEFLSESFRSRLSELQARDESSSALGSDIYGGDRKDDSSEVHSDFISHEDALGSADRLQQSSTHFVGEFVDETRGRQRLIGKGEMQIERLKAMRRPLKASSFNEGMPKEVSSSYKSLKLIPESSVQQIGVDGDKRSSRPSSEFSSASFRSGLSELQAQREESSSAVGSDIYGGDGKGDSHEVRSDFLSHEAALVSADRLQQSSMHFVGEFVDETRGRQSLTGKGELQIEPLKATRRPLKASSFNEGMPKEASSPYKALKLIPESSVQQTGVDDDDKRSSQPPSEFASASFRSGLSELHAQREENSLATGSDIYGGEPLDLISHEDALGSADRLQQSSTHFVGEFVEKIRQEVSTSESQKEKKTHETKLVQGKEEDKKKGVGQDGSGGSRRSSRGSGAKGPSDEMWHVAEQSIQGPPEMEAVPENPENTLTTTESGVVKRTGRSLWNVIGDIVRLRWASSRSETHTTKSGGKNSPNQSTGSEAWFSGHEVDENNGENVKREDTIFPQEASSADKQQSGDIRSETHELSSPISSTDKIKLGGVDSSSFSSTEGGLPLRAGSLPSVEGTSSGSGIAEQSFPVPAIRMRRSPMLKDTSEASQTSASGSGKMVEMEQPVPIRLPAVPATEAKDGKLKRRTFQRSDHVLKDRFDEWEEAHTLETEQRKTDEMFMREALLEARKGADMWEVPVGAVLVQNGEIIARGYNLVEDLRDSTAHAEMICIREASNVLRTWRLSDTTLYVTLEPCPMCAGAILQSRVDTVVWGAPNKLLGADGSWIRLFPNGRGGNDSELGDNAAAGPVHPFHPNIVIRRGILSSECADVMQQFFQLRRKKKEKKTEQQPPTPPSGLPVSHHHPSKLLTKMHDVFHIMFCL